MKYWRPNVRESPDVSMCWWAGGAEQHSSEMTWSKTGVVSMMLRAMCVLLRAILSTVLQCSPVWSQQCAPVSGQSLSSQHWAACHHEHQHSLIIIISSSGPHQERGWGGWWYPSGGHSFTIHCSSSYWCWRQDLHLISWYSHQVSHDCEICAHCVLISEIKAVRFKHNDWNASDFTVT